jgi:hypothetical protein
VKAPNEPPPCKPSDSFRGGQTGRCATLGSTGCGIGSVSAERLSPAAAGLKNANSWDGDSARPPAAFAGISSGFSSEFLAGSSGLAETGGAAAAPGPVDQISAADRSAVAAVRSSAGASSAAPFRSSPSSAPDETMSLISGNHVTRTTPNQGYNRQGLSPESRARCEQDL